ncbi:MAG: hypothetical protein H0X36_01625 [Sphingomonadaceae bacterium]|nr:hypothetical protein [Sphingomonadaceae bacterium]
MEKVGNLKAGLLCLPKGILLWRDVAHPSGDALAARKTAALKDAGLSVAAHPDPLSSDPPPLTRYRIKVIVERVALRLCVAGLGIGEKKPSGEGVAAVRWETYDRAARARVASVAFELPLMVGGRDARTQQAVLGDALVESAARYAKSRRKRLSSRLFLS